MFIIWLFSLFYAVENDEKGTDMIQEEFGRCSQRRELGKLAHLFLSLHEVPWSCIVLYFIFLSNVTLRVSSAVRKCWRAIILQNADFSPVCWRPCIRMHVHVFMCGPVDRDFWFVFRIASSCMWCFSILCIIMHAPLPEH